MDMEWHYAMDKGGKKWKLQSSALQNFTVSILDTLHDLSWLTFHPISLQRHSPCPLHVAAVESLRTMISAYTNNS